jgi:prepilin-type N-terminal cleavage/methylation domain-containing protein
MHLPQVVDDRRHQPPARTRDTAAGFTLVEVLVAIALFVTMATGVAQLVAVATRAMRASREQTMAVMLAAARMDQLRALEWSYAAADVSDPIVERSDFTTHLSTPDLSAGGSGLRASPDNALAENVPPFVDYLDDRGRWVGDGTAIPPTAVFIRRWLVRPLAAAPDRSLVLQVLVTTVRAERSRGRAWSARSGGEALLTSVRTRARQ